MYSLKISGSHLEIWLPLYTNNLIFGSKALWHMILGVFFYVSNV